MAEPDMIGQAVDRLEIQNILTRYCTAIDSKRYEMLDEVFTPEAFIDYTSAGGAKGQFPEIREWLESTLVLFPVTQHVVSNFDIVVRGDEATSRCVFFNPMGLGLPDGTVRMLFFGGYYNDRLVRTGAGWRIIERIEESTWSYEQIPEDFKIPE